MSSTSLDPNRLTKVLESVLLDHLGPAAIFVAEDAVASFTFVPGVPAEVMLRPFLIHLKPQLPSDIPREKICAQVIELYGKN